MPFESASGISYTELVGEPVIHFNKDGIALKTTYRCDWTDYRQFVLDLTGDSYMDGGEVLTRTLPSAYPFGADPFLRDKVYCVNATVEPFRDDKASVVAGSNSYQYAKVTAEYSTLDYTVDTNAAAPAPNYATDLGSDGYPLFTSLSIHYSGKDYPLPTGSFRWEGSDPNDKPDTRPAYPFPTCQCSFIRHQVPYDTALTTDILTNMIGTCNRNLSEDFGGGPLAGFAEGTLRLLSVAIKSTHTSLGAKSYEITYANLFIPNGHNSFPYTKDTGSWPVWKQLLNVKNGKPLFQLADWSVLFS